MTYDIEKFEINNVNPVVPGFVTERKVYWATNDKHKHDAAKISAIAKWLDEEYPHPNANNHWTVRANSYRSKQPSIPNDASAVQYS